MAHLVHTTGGSKLSTCIVPFNILKLWNEMLSIFCRWKTDTLEAACPEGSRLRQRAGVRHWVGVGHRAGVEYRAGVGLRSRGGTEDRGWTQSRDGAQARVGHREGTLAASVRVDQSAYTHLLSASLCFSKNVFFQFHWVFSLYTHTNTISSSLAIARILGTHFSGLRKQIRLTKLGACFLTCVLEVVWLWSTWTYEKRVNKRRGYDF